MKSRPKIWLAVLVFSASVFCTWGIVLKLQKNYDLAAHREFTVAVKKITAIITKDFGYQLTTLQELQKQWDAGGTVSSTERSASIRRLFQEFPWVHTLERVGKDSRLKWRFSERGSGDLQIDSMSEIVFIPLETDRITLVLDAAPKGGNTRLLKVFLPVQNKENFDGFLTATLQPQEWIAAIISPEDLSFYEMEVIHDGNLIFHNNSSPTIHWKKWGIMATVPLYNLNWELRLKPSPIYIGQLKSSVPLAVFLTGLSISFLLALLVHGIQIMRLNNRRLLIYQKQLQEKNTELAQYLFAASHDLQEPLNSIIGFLDLFREDYRDRFDEQAHQYFEFIQNGTKRMKAFIVGLLSYSEVGKNHPTPEAIELDVVLQEVLDDLQGSIQKKKAKIKVSPLPVVTGFRLELKQLFQNLISNAIKYHKKGILPKIEIAVEQQNGDWQFCVKDNGIGIDEKFNQQIFIIFQRLHKKNVYQGAGIGLSISKKIVELHKGKIWVESKSGQGSSFYFTIPHKKLSSSKRPHQRAQIENANVPDYSSVF